MNKIQQKYLKDENNNIISPIVSSSSVMMGGGVSVQDCLTNQTDTFNIILENGYTYGDEVYLNKGYYNKLTRQVTIVYFIFGTVDATWRKMARVPSQYKPIARIYNESTYGQGRNLIYIDFDGSIWVWGGDGISQTRGNITYYTF